MPTFESVVRCDPDVLGGTPVFAGTRVPVKNLLDYLAAGDSLERFIDHFPSVTREQAVAARDCGFTSYVVAAAESCCPSSARLRLITPATAAAAIARSTS